MCKTVYVELTAELGETHWKHRNLTEKEPLGVHYSSLSETTNIL